MRRRKRVNLSLTVACSLLLGVTAVSGAEPLALQQIMKEMGTNMQSITDGISREEWELVEKAAHLIAEHPEPPFAEKLRILNFVGTHLGKFKEYNRATHDQAEAVGLAAKAEDGAAVIFAFQKLQTSCFNCHHEFRKPFIAHFYGADNGER